MNEKPRLSHHSCKTVDFYTLSYNDAYYKIKRISRLRDDYECSRVTYEFERELTNQERSDIIKLIQKEEE